MTEAERQMRRGLSSLLLEAPVSVIRDLSARVQAREDELSSEIVRLRAELDEQARLNGMGAERELALRGEVERLRVALGKAYRFISPLSDPMPITAGEMARQIMRALEQSAADPVEKCPKCSSENWPSVNWKYSKSYAYCADCGHKEQP